jgi:hypothetical protein
VRRCTVDAPPRCLRCVFFRLGLSCFVFPLLCLSFLLPSLFWRPSS